MDARDPRRLGRSWAAAVGADLITDEPDTVEARLRLTDEFFLDLCFQRVAALSTSPSRLQLVDAEGNPLRVPGDTGPFAALRFDSADPAGRPPTAHPAPQLRTPPTPCAVDPWGAKTAGARRRGPGCGHPDEPARLAAEHSPRVFSDEERATFDVRDARRWSAAARQRPQVPQHLLLDGGQ